MRVKYYITLFDSDIDATTRESFHATPRHHYHALRPAVSAQTSSWLVDHICTYAAIANKEICWISGLLIFSKRL